MLFVEPLNSGNFLTSQPDSDDPLAPIKVKWLSIIFNVLSWNSFLYKVILYTQFNVCIGNLFFILSSACYGF